MVQEDRIRNSAITIGTTPLLVAPQLMTGQRTAITLINTSTGGQIITLQWGEQGSIALSGIVLYPSGSWSEAYDGYFIPSGLEVWGVADGAGAKLAIQERVRGGI